MHLYSLKNDNLNLIKEEPFTLERQMQTMFEANLELLTGLQLVKSEFMIKNRRIDTLAYDWQNNAFIIIEYKRSQHLSVFDQGVTYLNLMLENKADFIVEYNESCREKLKRSDVDWSQSRIIFVSTGFTETQRQAVNFRDFGIELWEVKRFENEIVIVNQLKKSTSAPSIKDLSGSNETLEHVEREIREYSEEDHLLMSPQRVRELYHTYRQAILNLADGISVEPKKVRLSFTRNNFIFSDITIQKSGIKLWINLKKDQLDDPKKLARDVSATGHWGNGHYELKINDTRQLEYIMSLVKQAIR